MAFLHFHFQVFTAVKEKGLISVESEDDVFLDFVLDLGGDALGVDGEEQSNVDGCFEIIVGHSGKVFDFDAEIGRAVVDDFPFVFGDENVIGEVAAVVFGVGDVELWSF